MLEICESLFRIQGPCRVAYSYIEFSSLGAGQERWLGYFEASTTQIGFSCTASSRAVTVRRELSTNPVCYKRINELQEPVSRPSPHAEVSFYAKYLTTVLNAN